MNAAEHLLDGVGKAELEDAAGDGLEGRLVADVDLLPALLAAGVVKGLEEFRVLRREPRTAFRALDLDVPRVLFAGRDALES